MPFHKKNEWFGPKEWRPARPEAWMDSPLLSPDENKKISLLFAESKREGGIVTLAEIAWICETIKKVSHCGPDDYSFPASMALYNPIANNAYAMHFKNTTLIEYSYKFENFIGATLLSHTTESPPVDALMLIRPYVKILPPADPATVLGLRRSTVVMTVDGEEVLRSPLDEHLILLDGSSPRKVRWKYRPARHPALFEACPIDAQFKAHSEAPDGIACPNGSLVVVSLFMGRVFDGPVDLLTGLVAANYSAAGPVERTP